jgi:eukaryotic-like serine/threonine-protein kinase
VLPTQSAAANLTAEGTILGTFQYMAPEQVEGQEADARTDIFAFGAVLYEMTTGKRAFSGTSHASLIGAILKDEPAPISSTQPMTPPALDRVVTTCLAKDPEDRWQSIHDVGLELRRMREGKTGEDIVSPRATPRRNRDRAAWAVAAALLLALAASLSRDFRRGREAPKTIRFSIAPPEKADLVSFPEAGSLALSPDGSSLALIAATEGKTSLWVRRLDALAATELPGTAGAVSPFWSPDGRFIGYFAAGRLQKIAAGGGPPQSLCESTCGSAATWGRDGTILFTEFGCGREGIYRVSAQGGAPAQVTSPDRSRGERSQNWPFFLPDGEHFVYLSGAFGVENEKRNVSVGSLGSRGTRPILTADSRVAYSPPGYLFFVRDGALLAQRFDVPGLRAMGDPIPISDDVWFFRPTGNAGFSVSEKGDVAYLSGRRPSRLAWRDRTGRETVAATATALFGRLRLAPDGSRIAVQVADRRSVGSLNASRRIRSMRWRRSGLPEGTASPSVRAVGVLSTSTSNPLMAPETSSSCCRRRASSFHRTGLPTDVRSCTRTSHPAARPASNSGS